ncbi:hypothetical protein [Actinospica robiniae]|uniref:hypothetical protein n=1 Tax=Actinospica robiniae TaxID=304901 RepID=UPI00146FAB7C
MEEELGLARSVPLSPLQITASISARFFADRDRWPAGIYVVPERSFATDLLEQAAFGCGEVSRA